MDNVPEIRGPLKEEVWETQARKQLLWYVEHGVTILGVCHSSVFSTPVSLCYICGTRVNRSSPHTWDVLPSEEGNINDAACYVVCCTDCTYCLTDDEKYKDVEEATRMFEQMIEESGAEASMALDSRFS